MGTATCSSGCLSSAAVPGPGRFHLHWSRPVQAGCCWLRLCCCLVRGAFQSPTPAERTVLPHTPPGLASRTVGHCRPHLWGGQGASHSGLPCGVDVGNALESGHCPRSLKMGWIGSSPPPRTGRCQSQSLHLEWKVRRKVKWQGT